jgi:hypothetical protein
MKKLALTAAVALAGFATAALVVSSPAHAYTPDQLPNLGYSVIYSDLGAGCHQWQAGYGNSSPKTDLGNDCDSGFQARLDAFINATCPCAQPPTTSTAAAPSPPVTTPDPTTTTTTQTVSVSPSVTTTVTDPVTTTVTVTTTVADPVLSARVQALEDAFAALKTRVGNLEAANDAAWLAYEDALTSGKSPQEAADIARGTALNLIYGLGVFAP